jgi:hypothetical protein
LFIRLQQKENLEYALWLWDLDLEFNECLSVLSDFDFNCLQNQFETAEGLIRERFLMQFRARFKFKGQIWVIHKYDLDPFPSNPHAHDLEQNIKLDLSNGDCFRVRTYLHTIRRKDLLALRQAAQQVYEGELPLLQVEMKS